ncbi:MAG: beta-galactosidase trimerization domain-containing protein [Clostridia bacterium]|nr:beta-galactosidase trimerization domain-containing protein [Clostridia bacterium]
MKLSFRQVHLDFHTSECIDGIGEKFDKKQFQEMLKLGHVSSITVFSKCHHGWAYHPSDANEMHPGLKFDLLQAQIEAAHEIGVKTPVYLSAGVDEKLCTKHPEWKTIVKDPWGNFVIFDPFSVGFHELCLNTPYLDMLLAQIKEVCERYDADGIFLDIVGEKECYCPACMAEMQRRGWDPHDRENARKLAVEVYANYTRRVRETIDSVKPGLPVFHNGGHIIVGRRELAYANTHLEMESLPTGGWGYDHFPMSVAYCRNFGMEMLGMTGKFHTSWGEFGGYKHKNALRYEVALSMANGAKCSIGDQLHPGGEMSRATYALIGAAYQEAEEKEAWCDDVDAVADIGVLSVEAFTKERIHPDNIATEGVNRMLLEGHYLFDILDMESDFNRYKVVILPDKIPMTEALQAKLDAFVAQGGKILASGASGIADGKMVYDLGCTYEGPSAYQPAYVVPSVPLANMDPGTYVIYKEGYKVQPTGVELAKREESYFNKGLGHFCSHQHTPNSGVTEGSAITVGSQGAYISWSIFTEYREMGSLILRDLVCVTLDTLLGEGKTLTVSLPALGVTTLMDQKGEHRLVHHLLYATPVKRGNGIEVIEDIVPVYNIDVVVRPDKEIQKVYLAPQMVEIPFAQKDGVVSYKVEKVDNHQMVVLEY